MSEEIKNATVVVPRSIVFGLIMNGAIGFGIVITTLFCLGDPNTISDKIFISFHSNLCASNKVQGWQCRHGSVDSPGGTRS